MVMKPRHGKIHDQLLRAADIMLQGSLSQTTRTCGRRGCRCQRGQRHGPHTYLTFRTENGRSSGLYVPKAELAVFRRGVAAWERFWELATGLARQNREVIAQRRRARARRRLKDAR